MKKCVVIKPQHEKIPVVLDFSSLKFTCENSVQLMQSEQFWGVTRILPPEMGGTVMPGHSVEIVEADMVSGLVKMNCGEDSEIFLFNIDQATGSEIEYFQSSAISDENAVLKNLIISGHEIQIITTSDWQAKYLNEFRLVICLGLPLKMWPYEKIEKLMVENIALASELLI